MHIMNPSVEVLESFILETIPATDGVYDQHKVQDFLSDFDTAVAILSQKLEEIDYSASMEQGTVLKAPFALLSSGAVVREVVMRPSFIFTSEDDNMEYAVVEGNQAFSGERFITDSLLALHNVKSRLQETSIA